ncbi:hypothetical protein DSO57_1023670 [Entomophthora muscae]|uniref:Uncharacterized protein n=1 Tax=Entomophthora muscae TaxID=34485 RepID=A0ACC2TPP2_9FUNG|nr:hypothetical protein DSO57_1023670 [Entomophthora muscae]
MVRSPKENLEKSLTSPQANQGFFLTPTPTAMPFPYFITEEIVSYLELKKLYEFRLINRHWNSAIILARYLYQDIKIAVGEPIVEIEKYAPPKSIRRIAFLQEDVKAQDVPRDYSSLFALTKNVFSLNFCTGIRKAREIMAVSNQLERITQISMCLGRGEHHLLVHCHKIIPQHLTSLTLHTRDNFSG